DVPLDRTLDRIVDADQLAATVEQRAAGVPGVDRRVGLDHAGERPSVGGGRAAIQAGDDAGRERTLKAERRTDGERGVADLQAVGVAQGQRVKLVRRDRDSDHGEVRALVDTLHLAGRRAAVAEGHADLVGTRYHVRVGEDIALGVDHDPGALRLAEGTWTGRAGGGIDRHHAVFGLLVDGGERSGRGGGCPNAGGHRGDRARAGAGVAMADQAGADRAAGEAADDQPGGE